VAQGIGSFAGDALVKLAATGADCPDWWVV